VDFEDEGQMEEFCGHLKGYPATLPHPSPHNTSGLATIAEEGEDQMAITFDKVDKGNRQKLKRKKGQHRHKKHNSVGDENTSKKKEKRTSWKLKRMLSFERKENGSKKPRDDLPVVISLLSMCSEVRLEYSKLKGIP